MNKKIKIVRGGQDREKYEMEQVSKLVAAFLDDDPEGAAAAVDEVRPKGKLKVVSKEKTV